MIFTGQNVTISMLGDNGEWVDIGAGVFQPQMPMEKPVEEIDQSIRMQLSVPLRRYEFNVLFPDFWKPPVVRQTEPFWVKKWGRNR